MQTINICPCYKLQCLVLENWLRQWKNKEKTDTQTQGQKNPAHSTGAPTKQQGSRTLARYYVQCSMRGKAHLSGRFLYTSSLRCGPLEGGSCSCLCLQTGQSFTIEPEESFVIPQSPTLKEDLSFAWVWGIGVVDMTVPMSTVHIHFGILPIFTHSPRASSASHVSLYNKCAFNSYLHACKVCQSSEVLLYLNHSWKKIYST